MVGQGRNAGTPILFVPPWRTASGKIVMKQANSRSRVPSPYVIHDPKLGRTKGVPAGVYFQNGSACWPDWIRDGIG